MSVTINAPVTGDILRNGKSFDIDYDYSGSTTDIEIHYSTDGGSIWNLITTQSSVASGTGITYAWSPSGLDSETVTIRVRDANNTSDNDVSDTFSVRDVSLSITGPTTGVPATGVHINSSCVIRWLDSDATKTDNVKIEVIHSGGTTTLVASTTNDGSWHWKPSLSAQSGVKIKVSSTDSQDSGNWVESGTFTITSSDIATSGNNLQDVAAVYTMPVRIRAMKGETSTEAAMVGQIVSSESVYVQKKSETNASDRFDIEHHTRKKLPSSWAGDVTLVSAGDSWNVANGFYGEHYVATVTHGWDLETRADSKYDLNVTVHNKYEGNTEFVHHWVEYVDGDSIKIHAVNKATTAPGETRSMVFRVVLRENFGAEFAERQEIVYSDPYDGHN